MKKKLFYIEGLFYEDSKYGDYSDGFALKELSKYGQEFDIYIDEYSLTTDFIFELNLYQLQTGILYSIFFIKDGNKVSQSNCIQNDSEINLFLRKTNRLIKSINELKIYSRKDTTIENIKKIINNPNAVLSCMLDGSNWRIHLSDGMILGKVERQSIESSFKYPTHVQDAIETKNNNVISGDSFGIAHIFLNSCSDSLIDRSLYGSNLNVVNKLLINTPSVIAGYRMKEGKESENLLHALLVKNGYSIKEIHYILNVNASLQGEEFSPYINFGDVCNKVSKDSVERLKVIKEDGNWIIFNCSEYENNYYECNLFLDEVEINDIFCKNSQLVLRNCVSDIFFTYIPYINKKMVKCIWFSYQKFQFNNCEISIESLNTPQSIASYFSEVINNVQKLNLLGLNSSKLKNKIDEFSRFTISKLLSSTRYNYNDELLNQFRKSEEKVYKGIKQVFKEALTLDFPIEHFHSKSRIDSLPLTSGTTFNCPNCGSPIFIKKSVSIIQNSERLSGICRTCHNPFDITTASKINQLIDTKLSSNKTSKTLEVTIKNNNEYSTSSYYVFFIPTTDYSSDIDDIQIEYLMHGEGYYVLPKDETLKFQIDFTRAQLDLEVDKFIDFNIFVIENGNVEFFSQKVLFPSRSKIPRYDELKNSILAFLDEHLSEARKNHSLNVAKEAVKLSKYYGENIYESEIAALLHDSAKGFNKNQIFENYLLSQGVMTAIGNYKLPHAHVGKEIAEKIFNIDNTQILSAIYWHTTGRKNMTNLEKIIFVSDYIAEDRTFENVKCIKDIAYSNLDKAVGEIMNFYIEKICKINNLTPNLVEIECRDFYGE